MGVQRRVRRRFAGPNGQATRIDSAQGVRQGDPLGPLLFSLAIRPFLEDLSKCIGSEHSLFAYLDDIFILSMDGTALAEVNAFFNGRASPIALNRAKCRSTTFDDIRHTGYELLGTCVGPRPIRHSFLTAKIEVEKTNLQKLDQLHHQHALLILRLSLQQNLRHLQRSLRSHDLPHLWTVLDNAILTAHNRHFSRPPSDR